MGVNFVLGDVGLNIVYRDSERTGLDWSGNPSGRRAIVFTTLTGFTPNAATWIWKIYQRQQVSGVGDLSRYYTTFFYGNNGSFNYGAGYDQSYYGAHPYPIPANTGDGKWEISVNANDYITRDDTSAPYLTEKWHSQAFRVQNTSGNIHEFKFWIDLPSVTTANTITQSVNSARTTAPSPCIIFGQAPDNGSGQSWGGYSRWEETNGIIRGVQIYAAVLTEAQITALAALETNAAVLAKCTELGISAPWYLNMNWTVTDISDKSGNGHDPSWAGSARPTLWTG